MTTIIEASRIYWPAFVEPAASPIRGANPRYGCAVILDDVPDYLHDHVIPKAPNARLLESNPNCPELADNMLCRLNQPFKPRLTTNSGFDGLRQVAKLYELAGIANIKPDRLFHAIPARLAVEPAEYIEAASYGATERPVRVKALQIVSVRIDTQAVIDNLDCLLAEHWT